MLNLTVLETEILALNKGRQVTVYFFDGTKEGKREDLFIIGGCKVQDVFRYVMHKNSRPKNDFDLNDGLTLCASKGFYLVDPLQIISY